ncbi:MAG: hypothetical protein ACR2GY_01225 [Phycisphaerales bacterium]
MSNTIVMILSARRRRRRIPKGRVRITSATTITAITPTWSRTFGGGSGFRSF